VTPIGGQWPELRKRIFFDFQSKQRAPENDGIVAPEFEAPEWVDRATANPLAVDVARRSREDAEAAAGKAEDKASRLVQVVLALLTIALALGSYQLGWSLDRSGLTWFSLIPVTVALASLTLSAFEALQIDRVGMYDTPDGSQLTEDAGDSRTELLKAEVRGTQLAKWTSNHKHSDLMQARAWFTRGLAALLMAGLVAGVTRASSHSGQTANSTTTTTASHPSIHGGPSRSP
jgi:hypothetical protein